jgi:hypothetical protein
LKYFASLAIATALSALVTAPALSAEPSKTEKFKWRNELIDSGDPNWKKAAEDYYLVKDTYAKLMRQQYNPGTGDDHKKYLDGFFKYPRVLSGGKYYHYGIDEDYGRVYHEAMRTYEVGSGLGINSRKRKDLSTDGHFDSDHYYETRQWRWIEAAP